jgi:hypothetical protein
VTGLGRIVTKMRRSAYCNPALRALFQQAVYELVRALKDARDLVEALLKSSGQPPQWLIDDAQKELAQIDDLIARLEVGRT